MATTQSVEQHNYDRMNSMRMLRWSQFYNYKFVFYHDRFFMKIVEHHVQKIEGSMHQLSE